jgi:hypothetical protein
MRCFVFKLYYINHNDYNYSPLVWRDMDKPWKFWVTTENLWTQKQNHTLLSMISMNHYTVMYKELEIMGEEIAMPYCRISLASVWESADNADKDSISESPEYVVSIIHKTRHHRFLKWPHTTFLIPKFAMTNPLPLLKQIDFAPSVIQCLLLCNCCRVCIIS